MITTTVAIDPGVAGCGVAVFSSGALKVARYVRPDEWDCWGEGDGGHVRIVVEKAQVYRARLLKGDPNDLIAETICGAELAGFIKALEDRSTQVEYIWPAEWKKQLPKKICHARLKKILTAEEESRIKDAGALTHNVLDAVGIGLWALGRFRP